MRSESSADAGRSRSDRPIPNPHGLQPVREGVTVGTNIIAYRDTAGEQFVWFFPDDATPEAECAAFT